MGIVGLNIIIEININKILKIKILDEINYN